jgi:hypothetical protein
MNRSSHWQEYGFDSHGDTCSTPYPLGKCQYRDRQPLKTEMKIALIFLIACLVVSMLLYAGKWEGMPWQTEAYTVPDIKTDTVR